FTVHDPTQLIVGIVAERPEGIVGGLDLLPNQNQVAPVILPLEPGDLPGRVEAWGPIDRLIWQDVDTASLEPDQLAALRGWLAGGGRLIIAGGTAGPAGLTGLPDAMLPYRPIVTIDAPAASLTGLLGTLPKDAGDVPALSGDLIAGRVLAGVGDRAVAAERPYGSGLVTLLGFDPTTPWMTESKAAEGLWRRLLPARTMSGFVIGDDNQMVSAVSQLPSLALPPIGGLLALLGAYILLIGPINYLVLRRLNRREWAWVTMPVLILVFAVGAYGFGAALRGSDVIVNEVAIVRGAPGTTEGAAQVYLGVFSPSRGTYDVKVPGGALLSSPISGSIFGGDGTAAVLDVLQGEPATVRSLAVGFGSLRTIRAESAADVPLIESSLRLEDGRLKGTIKNLSDQLLTNVAVVLGSNVGVLSDLAAGSTVSVDVAIGPNVFGPSISERIVGASFFGDPTNATADVLRSYVRRAIIDQLTYDAFKGSQTQISSDGPVILAWGTRDLLDVRIEGQQPRRTGNVLFYLPSRMSVGGATTFHSDLMRSSVVETDAAFLSNEGTYMGFGQGSVTVSYRPLSFEGTFTPTRLILNMNFGDQGQGGLPKEIEPLAGIPPACDPLTSIDCTLSDGLPEIEVFDRTGSVEGGWRRLPHLQGSARYALADPERFVDPSTGAVLVRFVNDRSEQVGLQFTVELVGDVR
ncbi:MAG: hypothetical protein H0V74_02370, partial [Chloroflexi bacterium]|nr:hypothetical protein [Chloroflexota bacterium]